MAPGATAEFSSAVAPSILSVPSVQTPSDTAAPVEQVPEQVGEQLPEQGKKKKITIAELNEQAKARREAKQKKAETAAAEQTSEPQKPIDKITSAKAGSRERIMAFTELPDGEHTVNGKSFTKSGNLFTIYGKTLNAKEIEKATRTTSEKMRKTVEETVSDTEIADTPKAEAAKSEVSDKSDKKETSASEKTDSAGNTVLFSKQGDLQTEQESKKQKSSTVAKSSTGLSQPFPDYRGLGGNSIKIATAALQSVEHDHNIASASKKVNGYFEKAKKILSDIKNGNPVFVNRFLETLLNMGFVKHGRDSVYFQVDDLSTIRLSNHTSNASNFSTIGESASNVSLVLRSAIQLKTTPIQQDHKPS